MKKHWVLVGILASSLCASNALAQHQTPNQQPNTATAPTAPAGCGGVEGAGPARQRVRAGLDQQSGKLLPDPPARCRRSPRGQAWSVAAARRSTAAAERKVQSVKCRVHNLRAKRQV